MNIVLTISMNVMENKYFYIYVNNINYIFLHSECFQKKRFLSN